MIPNIWQCCLRFTWLPLINHKKITYLEWGAFISTYRYFYNGHTFLMAWLLLLRTILFHKFDNVYQVPQTAPVWDQGGDRTCHRVEKSGLERCVMLMSVPGRQQAGLGLRSLSAAKVPTDYPAEREYSRPRLCLHAKPVAPPTHAPPPCEPL